MNAVYQDKEYREWIQKQPSCLSGRFSEYVDGEGRSIAAHVRRAKNSGIGYKPLFSSVPMTDEEHRYQHQHGELACLSKFHRVTSEDLGPYGGTTYFEKKADEYFEKWKQLKAPPKREEW